MNTSPNPSVGRQHTEFIRAAYAQALKSYNEGGLPIGAVMVEQNRLIAEGHNRRVQDGNPIAHGEMNCMRRAGRRSRYDDVVLYTTLSPCMMCSGTILRFGVACVVIGENLNFPGSLDFLRSHGVEVELFERSGLHRADETVHRRATGSLDEDIASRSGL